MRAHPWRVATRRWKKSLSPRPSVFRGVMVHIVMTHIVMVHIVMAYKVMAHVVMAHTATAHIVMAPTVMTHIVTARPSVCVPARPCLRSQVAVGDADQREGLVICMPSAMPIRPSATPMWLSAMPTRVRGGAAGKVHARTCRPPSRSADPDVHGARWRQGRPRPAQVLM